MTTERLDPNDLRAAARIIRDACDRGGPLDDNTTLADRLDLAAEAASRPPTLSDFVRACEVSRLGAPTVHVTFDGANEHDFAIVYVDDKGVRVETIDINDDGKDDEWDMRTVALPGPTDPAELTAALNALADEVPRG